MRNGETVVGKIFYIMGKSASGKDNIYSYLLKQDRLKLQELVLYTTRPIRCGETDGKEYHFVDVQELERLREAGKIIEERSYDTVHGIWTYFTADDGQTDLDQYNYAAIGTLESYEKLKSYYGEEQIVPIYIEVEDGVRLGRALMREQQQKNPKYKELCRRFLADCEDFSEEQIQNAGIKLRFQNNTLEVCLKEVEDYIESML